MKENEKSALNWGSNQVHFVTFILSGGIQAVRMSGRRELEFVSMALLQW